MKRKNCMKRKYMFMALLCYALTTAAQDASHNYVRTRSMLDETGGKYLDKVEYFDGLGRPFQTVLKKVTASSSNLVTLQEYDVAGRAANSWLPIVSSAEYVAPASFKSSAPGNYGNDSRPYGQPVYEASPLNRTVKEYGPGAAWHGGHSVNTDYLANSTANAQLNCINYSVSSAGALTSNGSYASGQLSVVKTTDEDLNVSYTFTDKMGHVVLSRQMKGSETHDTYYVYDDKSNLCFVLQPMYQSSANLDQYAFQYKYDGRNRCIWKKLPGAGYMEIMPFLSVCYVIAGLANLGLPGLSGFIAEMTIFVGSFQNNDVFHRTLTIIACSSIVITAVYILRLVGKILYGICTNKHHLELTDATWDERVAVICLIVCVAGLGMAPFWVSHMIGESVLPVVSQLIP